MRNFKKVFRIKRECFLSLKRLSLALLPSEIDTLDTSAYVVIDVLRASTTIVTLFERGLSDLLVVNNLSQAVELSNEESRILFGEVGGTPPDGFDYGNSPSEISKLNLKNKKASNMKMNIFSYIHKIFSAYNVDSIFIIKFSINTVIFILT